MDTRYKGNAQQPYLNSFLSLESGLGPLCLTVLKTQHLFQGRPRS